MTMGIVGVVLIGCLIAPVWSTRVRVTGSCKCDCPAPGKDAETINVILMERDMGESKLKFYACLGNKLENSVPMIWSNSNFIT